MKIMLTCAIFALSAQLFAGECQSVVRSKEILKAVDYALTSTLNRDENAYENALSFEGNEAPKICSYESFGSLKQMEVSTKVFVKRYYEEGGIEDVTDTCFVYLVKQDGQWSANHITCDDQLRIDDEVY